MSSLPHRIGTAAIVLGLVLGLSACGDDGSNEVQLGGTQAAAQDTLDRPWGTVKTFPQLEKAEVPSSIDTMFAADMVMHHEQAVELSQNLLAHDGVEERIAATARFIVKDQENEIQVMTSWLDAWQSSLDTAGHGEHGGDSEDPMPGMLPQSQVDEVTSLESAEAQVHFLRSMLTHHEGALTMSRDYLPERTNSFTYSTAQHIIREQGLEITYMTNLVDELCSAQPVSTCPES
ncbi:MAG: DUF305 domain-containing protein [Aeromicrobium sp.]